MNFKNQYFQKKQIYKSKNFKTNKVQIQQIPMTKIFKKQHISKKIRHKNLLFLKVF